MKGGVTGLLSSFQFLYLPKFCPETAAAAKVDGAHFLSLCGEGMWEQCPQDRISPKMAKRGGRGLSSASQLSPHPHTPFQEERNLLLEEKVKTLQQENEDLQVRTQNHLIMAR